MRRFLWSIVALVMTCPNIAPVFAGERRCERILAQANSDSKSVSILWYPMLDAVPTHMKLQVDETIFSAKRGYPLRTLSGTEVEARARSGGEPFWRFGLRVSPEEFQRINQEMQERSGQVTRDTCVGSACGAVTRNSRIFIPMPFSKVPSLAALYLAVTHGLGYSRIVSIEYVGKRHPLFSFMAWGLGTEIGAFAVAGAVALIVVQIILDDDHDGPDGHKEKKIIVPIKILH